MTEIGGDVADGRTRLAEKYIAGTGIEVGALDAPYPLGRSKARIRYVDRLPKQELLRHYPELTPRASLIKDPDIIDDGEVLSSLPADSQDFIVASHFLEHCENPLGTLASHYRVLKPGGHLLLAVPNTANPQSGDHRRPRTTFDHLVRDDTEGPQLSRAEHFLEWVTFAGGMTGEVALAEQKKLMEMKYSIHFHCWEDQSFRDFLARAAEYKGLALRLVAHYTNHYEIAVVLQKSTGSRVADWVNSFKRRISNAGNAA